MKLINIPAIIAFSASAFVQLNDPDPILWVAYYGLAAVACALSLFNFKFRMFPIALGVCGFLWAGSLLPQLQAAEDPVIWAQVFGNVEMKTMSVELVREIGGLMLVSLWMAFIVGLGFSKKESKEPSEK